MAGARLTFIAEDGSHPIPPYSAPGTQITRPAKYSHGLAGIDDLFAKCTRFCLTAFAQHAFTQRVRGGKLLSALELSVEITHILSSPWFARHWTKRRGQDRSPPCHFQSYAGRPENALM